jgi:heme A synthase
MLTAHHAVAFLVLAVTWAAALLAGLAYVRKREPRSVVTHLLALAQSVLIAQVALGLLLLSEHHRAPQRLHYLYGTLSLLAVLAPWMYAPADRRARLRWFAGATLVAGALAVRAYMTGT